MLLFRARLSQCAAFTALLGLAFTLTALPAMGQTDLPSTGVSMGASMVQPVSPSPAAAQDAGSIQIYNVPVEMVGVVGARLRVLYGNDARVNITTEPGTGRLMVMAPPTIHQDIAARVELLQKDIRGTSPAKANGSPAQPASMQRQYKLQHVTGRDLEESLQRLSGPRMTVTTSKNGEVAQFRLTSATGTQDILQIDRKNNTVTLQGPSSNVYSWMQVVGAIDQGRGAGEEVPKIVSLAPADPKRVERALNMVRTVALQQKAEEDQAIGSAKVARPGPQGDDERASAIGSIDSLDTESGLFGDVQIEFVGELGLVIVRGGKRDVQRVLEVIEQIKKQSEGTQPEVEVVLLKHINSQALETIATELYEEVLLPRQGPISIKALVQPNALLLVGRRESIASVIDLVKKLDQPLDESSQLKVYKLKHTSSTDAESLINDFFVEAPGSTNPVPGLGARVRIISDYRTNALVVQASPRDHLEVKRLLDEIDIETTTAQSEIRVFPLKYALATELQPILQSAISGQAVQAQGGQGGGQQGGGGGGGGANSADGRVTPPSSNLSIVSKDKARTDSGILAGVIVTSNPSINSLLVRAPGKSMELIAALIEELDRPPSAESQLKVFEIKNGDATSLALLVQQLFGLPTTAGASTTGLFGGGGGNQNQGGASATGATGIVPLRVSVDTRTNSIIAAGSAVDLEVLEVLLARLDERGIETRTTEVIWLRNSNANNVATAISSLLQQQRTNIQQLLLTGQAISIFEQIDREVLVVAEPTTNSLIVSATPRYFQRIRDVIERLDRRPPMIMVQILLAEVLLEDNFELGTELGLQDALLFDRNSATGGTLTTPGFNVAGATGSTILSQPLAGPPIGRGTPQNVAGQGLSNFGLGRSNSALGYGGLVLSAASESVNILFRALQDANRLQILSRPQVMTLDTVAAFVQVGSQVPRITSVSGGSTVAPPVISTQDVPVGLIMRVQPRTNQDGLILMDVQIERSKLGPESQGIPVGFSSTGDVIRSPVIDTTRAETRVSAYDGQTVVFAGLISKNRTSRSRRIPFLADIPIAGYLFKFESEQETRSELLVVMTPRIINDAEDIEMINQMESARMSWCMADVMNLHGVAGLSDGNGLWGPACSPVIYPDLQPTVDMITDQYGNPIGDGSMIIESSNGEPTPAAPAPMIYSSPVSPVPNPGNPSSSVAPAAPIEVSSFSSQRGGNTQVAPAAAQSDPGTNALPGTYITR
jgi:type II secretion system protein D